MSRVWGWVLAVTGFVACPCHLPLTLPFIVGVLGGTGIGSFIGANTNWVYGIATGYFIVGIAVGVYLLKRKSTGRLPLEGNQKISYPANRGRVT